MATLNDIVEVERAFKTEIFKFLIDKNMKKVIIILTISSMFLTSCYKQYDCIFVNSDGVETGQMSKVRAFSQKQADRKCEEYINNHSIPGQLQHKQ